MKKILLASPTMHDKEQQYIKEAFDTNWIAPLGANVDNFEKEIAAYLGIRGAAACVSGTSALFLAYKLAGVGPDDIVFCSDLTFAATVNPASYLGGRQVFIDSEPDSWNMSPEALEKAFKKYPQCKCVALAHLYGTPAKLDEITDICARHGAVLIEDAAESLSATYRGRQTGTFGKYNAISFNGNKIITTSGGGMLLSDDDQAIAKARFWSTQARDPAPWYQHSELGFNFRMSNIVAGIGRGQLHYIDDHRAMKKRIYEKYRSGLANLPVKMNPYLPYTEPNFWLSCFCIDADCPVDPMAVYNALAQADVESRPIWKPMHMQPLYNDRDYITLGDNIGEKVFSRGLCLPSDIKMTEEQQEYVIGVIRSCFGE